MPSITLTDVVAHTLADAGVLNNNNSALRSVINGGLDNANISPAAGISPAKLLLPGGTTTFLRGDGTWAVPGAAGAGSDIVYTPFSGTISVTATTAAGANTIVTGSPSFAADGTSSYWVEFYAPSASPHIQGRNMSFNIWEGSADQGAFGFVQQSISGGVNMTMAVPVFIRHRFTPGSGSRTYGVRCYMTDGSGTSTVSGSGYIRVYKA